MFKWLFKPGGSLPLEAKEPELVYRFTRGYGCGEHCSTDFNGGVCSRCGKDVRAAVVRQLMLEPSCYYPTQTLWVDAEFIRWIEGETK